MANCIFSSHDVFDENKDPHLHWTVFVMTPMFKAALLGAPDHNLQAMLHTVGQSRWPSLISSKHLSQEAGEME